MSLFEEELGFLSLSTRLSGALAISAKDLMKSKSMTKSEFVRACVRSYIEQETGQSGLKDPAEERAQKDRAIRSSYYERLGRSKL